MICAKCRQEISELEGYFTEGADNYHEHCYANKQWDTLPIDVKKKWHQAMVAQIKAIKAIEDEELRKATLDDYVKRCVPKAIKRKLLE